VRAAVALALVTIAGAAALAAPGRVVRVERAHGIARTPRICQIQAGGTGTCWGKAPVLGETASVIDPQGGVLGDLRVSEVTPQLDSCGKIQRWEYKYTVESGSLDKAQWGSSLALFDIEVRAGRSQLLPDTLKTQPPDRKIGEQVFALIDRDGDGNGDLIGTAYMCDKNGDPKVNLPGVGYCIDYWDLGRGDWRMIRHDFVETCIQ
jgi:hypothetical protein